MTTLVRSGTKVTIFASSSILQKIAIMLRVPIVVGNEHVETSVSIPAKKLERVSNILKETK